MFSKYLFKYVLKKKKGNMQTVLSLGEQLSKTLEFGFCYI